MVNYANGKVYKIEPTVEHEEGDVYFGSTTKNYLSQRMDKHRCDFKNKKMNACCSSKILFQKFGVENCVIVLLEAVSATTNDELKAVEAKYIINNKCVNKYVPLRTSKQYVADNAVKTNDYQSQYRTDNKDKNSEYQSQYRTDNKEKIKENQSQYYATNADKIKLYQRQYRLKNGDIIREKDRQRCLKQKEQKAISENN